MGKLLQLHTAVTCSFGSLVMGLLNVWPSYTIASYSDTNSTLLDVPMTDFETTLLGSLPSLGAMVGTAVCGVLIDKIGRKKGGLVLALPFILSWAIIGLTSSSWVILAARLLKGTSGGAYLVYAPIFISEIAEDSIRGALASGPITFYCLGALFSYLLGWFCTYHNIIRINVAASVLCAILPMTVVESPVYLLRQKRENEARAAIARYRGASEASKLVLEELSALKQKINPAVELIAIKEDIDNKEKKFEDEEKEKLNAEEETVAADEIEVPEQMSAFKMLFKSPSSNRAFKIVFTAISLQVFMGMLPVQVYAKNLFAVAAPDLSSHFCSVLLAIILVIACLTTVVLADKAGRRILIISSSAMVAVCLITLGFLLQTGCLPPWVSAVVILIFCYSFNCGAGSVPYVLLAECFLPEVQGLASMLVVEWAWFLNFVIIIVFPFMVKYIGIHGAFYIFGVIAVANAVISYFSVPETKGLSTEEIQECFMRSRRK